jgi:hypothetical protein
MGDGAVRFVSDMVSLTAWQNAARFADGNLTTLDGKPLEFGGVMFQPSVLLLEILQSLRLIRP